MTKTIKRQQNKANQEKIRVRIAPSPTGLFHIGTARTALFNYLFAKRNKGKFVLRIEDTDKKRYQRQFEQDISENLRWLGIQPDEGLDEGGRFAPYRQSERQAIYQKYIKKLLQEKKAFYCFESEEEKPLAKNGFRQAKFSKYRDFDLAKAKQMVKKGHSYVIRFKTPKQGKVIFRDIVRGKIEIDVKSIADFSIAKSSNEPLYNLAVVIDDYEMKISHVIRGEDHISNTPKQILLQKALGFSQPNYAHLPLILGPDRTKLSKRHNAVSLSYYRKDGYLPEAMINFMALLGWNPGTNQEIFSLRELEEIFSLSQVQVSGAVFDLNKLDWMNGYYIRNLKQEKLVSLLAPHLKGLKHQPNKNYLEKIIAVSRDRLKKLSDFPEQIQFFLELPKYEKDLLFWKNMSAQQIEQSLTTSLSVLKEIKASDFKEKNLKNILMEASEKFAKDRGCLLWPLRVALTGVSASPSPFEVAAVLGKEESLRRIKQALKKI